MSDIVNIKLPTWDAGSLNIRLIYLVNDTSFMLSECPNKGLSIPLYLGADVLSNTDIRTENHPRYHAKFAKKGLATKLHFSSEFRLDGLRVPSSNNSLWFYSVQGLFRVAFELYNKHDQLLVLEHFQAIWKTHINDGPIQMSYNLSRQLDLPAISITDSRSEIPRPLRGTPTQQNLRRNCEDHDYCLNSRESQEIMEPNMDHSNSFHQLVKRLNDHFPQIQPEQLITIELLLHFIEDSIQGNLNENSVTDVVMSLLQAKQWEGVYSSTLLHSVGCWLGNQFHEANNCISQKVEEFKIRHINRISDLPPAEELTKELFPEAMLNFLLHWMGLSNESSLEKRHSEYPILLLILEFANHNLITGVAHVLYSSLICK